MQGETTIESDPKGVERYVEASHDSVVCQPPCAELFDQIAHCLLVIFRELDWDVHFENEWLIQPVTLSRDLYSEDLQLIAGEDVNGHVPNAAVNWEGYEFLQLGID